MENIEKKEMNEKLGEVIKDFITKLDGFDVEERVEILDQVYRHNENNYVQDIEISLKETEACKQRLEIFRKLKQ